MEATFEELKSLMEEPAGGYNHGRVASDNPNVDGSHLSLEVADWQAAEFMRGGGWSIVDSRSRAGEAGMSAHRGVLPPTEYVDSETLRGLVENELGFTYAEVHSVYRRGPVAGDGLTLRARIDARLLSLAKAGGNMVALGRALGFAIRDDGSCRTIENALARARALEDGSWS